MEVMKACLKNVDEIANISELVTIKGNELDGYFSSPTSRDKIKKSISNYFVCMDGESVVGYIQLEDSIKADDLKAIPEYKDYKYIGATAVHPDHYRKGVARLLKKYISDRYNWISLINITPKINLASISMNLKCGYTKLPVLFEDSKKKNVVAFTNRPIEIPCE